MHGRKRDETPLSAEEKSIKAEKIAKYNAAKAQLLEMRAARQYDGVSYSLTGKLIEINPDFYSLFNYRKEIVQHMWNKDPSSKSAISTAELELSFKALLKNPKCYSAWHHRLWILDHGDASAEEELKLCTKMLKMDARNFHSWNYRRAVAARAGTPAEVEFQYTTEKINENFSNYSAWHYRTVLIPRIYNSKWFQSGSEGIEARKKEYQQFLDSEFGLVQQAYYTEPSDQSGWLYHRWLLGRVVATGAANQLPVLGISIGTHLFEEKHQQSNIDQRTQEIESSTNSSSSSLFTLSSLDWHLTVFTRELQSVSELLEIEPDCKPALLTAAILQAGIIACRHQSGADASTQNEVTQLTSNIKEKFDRLIQLDPMRTNYYRDVRQRFIN